MNVNMLITKYMKQTCRESTKKLFRARKIGRKNRKYEEVNFPHTELVLPLKVA